MAAPLDARSNLQLLEDRSYATYKARLVASERLVARGRAWNASMLAFSSALAIAAVGMLTQNDLYGEQGEALMAGLSILSLVASLVVAQLNYAVRSRDMEGNYKEIQIVAQDAEYYKTHQQPGTTSIESTPPIASSSEAGRIRPPAITCAARASVGSTSHAIENLS